MHTYSCDPPFMVSKTQLEYEFEVCSEKDSSMHAVDESSSGRVLYVVMYFLIMDGCSSNMIRQVSS